MNNKKVLVLIMTIFVLVLMVGIAISYAFIGEASLGNSANIEGNIIDGKGTYNVLFSPKTSASLNVTLENLKSGEASNNYQSYAENKVSEYIKITSDSSKAPKGVRCNYDIYYTPINVYAPSTGAKELGLIELGIVGTSDKNKSFGPVSLDNAKEKIKIYSTSIATDASGEEKIENWDISLRYYNLFTDQSSALGQNPKGNITIELGMCAPII